MVRTSRIRRTRKVAPLAIFLALWLFLYGSGDVGLHEMAQASPETPGEVAPRTEVPVLSGSATQARQAPNPGPAIHADSTPKPRTKAKKGKTVRLFNTVEFKGRITQLPKWSGVLKQMGSWKGFFKDPSTAGLPSRSGWNKLRQEMTGLDTMGRLIAVNTYFNQWPYRLDAANFGVSDYWAIPIEFLKKSGDCEDYSIAKFYALQEFGFSSDQMRVVVVKDIIRNIGHAVLAVYTDGTAYILDNQTNMVLPHDRYKHYVPQYSVNERFRWMHIPVKQQQQ